MNPFLSDLLAAFRSRLSQAPLSLVTIDRIDIAKAAPSVLAHRGFGVTSPSTTNTDRYRDCSMAWVSDAIQVTLTHRVNPNQQQSAESEALMLEEQVRALLVDPGWQGDHHISYRSSTRGPHPQSSEWYLITMQFTANRDARLGGFNG